MDSAENTLFRKTSKLFRLFQTALQKPHQRSILIAQPESQPPMLITKGQQCFFKTHPEYTLQTVHRVIQILKTDETVFEAFDCKEEFLRQIISQLYVNVLPQQHTAEHKSLLFSNLNEDGGFFSSNSTVKDHEQPRDNILLELILYLFSVSKRG